MLGRKSLLFTALLFSASACNAITGADELVVKGGVGADGAGADGPGGGVIAGPGGAGQGGGQVGSGGQPQPVDTMVQAQGVNITEIALYQGVKRPLMKNGSSASSAVPIVEGRDALVRVFVATDGGYNGTPVTANLFVGEGTAPIVVTKGITGPSSDGALGSTINFDVPGGALLKGGSGFRVELQQPASQSPGGNAGAYYPANGFAALTVQSSGPTLKVKLVPVKYAADGSNRLPDTSPTQVKRYEDAFFAMYPVRSVEVTTRAAVSWNYGVGANGSGWGELLDAIASRREQDNAPHDVYYFGIFSPASSFGQYCGGACVSGLGMVGGPSDSWARAAIGLGYSGDGSTETAVHEIGHTHGRNHAPCGGAQGIDPGYPYSGAKLGAWGYNLLTKELLAPTTHMDMMAYCSPIWVSDYTYKALFDRIKFVNGAEMYFPPETLNRVYERARVDGEGNLTWMAPITLRTPPMAQETELAQIGPEGTDAAIAQFYPYDHLEGGVLMWPQAKPTVTSFEVQLAGKIAKLSR